MNIRLLIQSDLDAIRQLLWRYTETSLFILGNLETAPVTYTGKRHEGLYYGAFDGDELVALVVRYWNGNVMAQGSPDAVLAVWQQAPALREQVNGFIGPEVLCALLKAAYQASLDSPIQYAVDSCEVLYRLSLSDVILPAPLQKDELHIAVATESDMSFLTDWMVDYNVETLNAVESEPMREAVHASALARVREGNVFIVWQDGQPVATSSFNAKVTPYVQIGGVWTPPEHRRNGYAQACVAGSLMAARVEGFTDSILFTDQENIGARMAYERIGYQEIGHFGLYIIHP